MTAGTVDRLSTFSKVKPKNTHESQSIGIRSTGIDQNSAQVWNRKLSMAIVTARVASA